VAEAVNQSAMLKVRRLNDDVLAKWLRNGVSCGLVSRQNESADVGFSAAD
jgi:hypothetical protein